tara:strand:- start:7 stop:279 length:273 start_codon:yes stop_codon:yes gene_type:complete
MKLLKTLCILGILLTACNNIGAKKLTPYDAAQQACECMKLSKDSSEEGVQSFKDCNTKTTDMISEYKDDPEWMGKWREELMKILKDCMSE